MFKLNECRHIGNLTKDPEVTDTSTGKKRCTFSLAVSRTYVSANGERGTDFIQFTAFGKQAELASKYLKKGRKVAVYSHVETSTREVDGQRRYYTSFLVDKIEFLSSKAADSDDSSAAPAPAPAPSNNEFAEVDDDELPF